MQKSLKKSKNSEYNGRHIKLDDLKKQSRLVGLENQYLYKENIPAFPQPEFHVSNLKHDTNQNGLRGISLDGGFKTSNSLLWWSLSVGPDDIASAETRLLEETFPGRTPQQAQLQESFLEKFATSPAFLETSMLGSYRFTFPLEEVLKAYSDQFCSGTQPVMRVFQTVFYNQEVMYVVLVHSPEYQELYSDYPLLSDDPDSVCVYRDGRFIWRSEAMCETHSYQLIPRPDINQMEVIELFGYDRQFYVWDLVTVALHMEEKQVLKFDTNRLRGNLTFCEKSAGRTIKYNFDSFSTYQHVVKELWPDYPKPLGKSSLEHLAASGETESDSKE